MISVGEKYKEYATGEDVIKADFKDGSLHLYVLLNGISEEGKTALMGQETFKIYVENGVIFICVKFGPMVFDTPFSPGLQKFASGSFEFSKGAVKIFTLIFDSSDGECVKLNLAALSDKQSEKVKDVCREARPVRPEDNNYIIDKAYIFMTSEDMYKKGV